MWGASEEPPGTMEGGPPEPELDPTVSTEQAKSQLETFKEIMIRNKQSLKKKEEEAQEYAKKLSKFKSRAKYSRKSKDGAASSGEASARPSFEVSSVDEKVPDDVSQATTPKAKSSLLQKKLAEDREMFERRSKEMTESKRAVEEKVEAIKQQLDEKTAAMLESPLYQSSVNQTMTTSSNLVLLQEKENKISELGNRILTLEAQVLDLQENLKEKDSVIESKMQAVTLMSADLSKKGKTTLDTLEDTKDEMRSMQENFVLLETSLKIKNNSLLEQLRERDEAIAGLEDNIKQLEGRLETQKLAESASADFSRSTMDTLLETKDAMKSMQENFVIVESSLKSKNEHLLQQLEERELRLSEAQQRILQLETNAGIVKPPEVDDLEYKISKLEQSNRDLQNEKYELQKSIAELQNKLLSNEPAFIDGIVVEKDNRIAELENLVDELKKSNQLLEEDSREELQSQVMDLTTRNVELVTKMSELEQKVNELEAQRSGNLSEVSSVREDDLVAKLTKELDDLNKSMIKIKAQHKSQVKNLRRQLENFRKVSDTNAELVKLGNQVALLEEEKGNLQLSLVDFDELKASVGDLNIQIANLEDRVAAQTKEIETHIEAIAQLENQKLDLTQELIAAKQEISTLEAENAESENLRVTAEMKIVELEEQLETLNKHQLDNKQVEAAEELESLRKQVEVLTQENVDLMQKLELQKTEEKGSSDAGSTESFETIHEVDKGDLLKKIENLTQKNAELENKLSKLEERANVDSTDSFENISDIDRNELMKRIDLLTRENNDLVMKLSRFEEKGSSDTGSTESFEKIPEHVETVTKLELLTRENNELVIKAIKLEEKLNELNYQITEIDKKNHELLTENNELKNNLLLAEENNVSHVKLETELQEYKNIVDEQKLALEDLKLKLASKDEELKSKSEQISETENQNIDINALQRELQESYSAIEEWKFKYAGLEEKVQLLEAEKYSIEETLNALNTEKANLSAQLEEKEIALDNEKITIIELKETLESQNIHNQAEISSLKNEISRLSSQSEERESFLKKATEDYDELLEDLTNKNAANNLLQIRIDEIKNELEQYQTQADSLKLSNEEQRALIEDLENRLYESQGMLENNNLYINDLRNELSRTQELNEQMTTKFIQDTENYNTKLQEVITELQEKIAENATLTAQLNSIDEEATKSSFESRIKELEQDVSAKLEKMKKFAVKLKKKTIQCDELEKKITELEENLILEKDKVKALDEIIQQFTVSSGKTDNRIIELEGLYAAGLETVNHLNAQLAATQETLDNILQGIRFIGEQNIDGVIERMNRQQLEIDDYKEKARELGVRMQVMESQYVEQLYNIQSLQAANGLLLSKQEQINEKLENVEKLAEDRRLLIEQLEAEKESLVVAKEEAETQTTEDEDGNHCERCTSCQAVVRDMEAKLQERDAEIENLDNELATSIGKFVQMQEDLRFSHTGQVDYLRESYDSLMAQFNTLKTVNEEMKKQLDDTMQENKELMEKITSLQQLNDTLQETVEKQDPILMGELESLKENLAERDRLRNQYEEEITMLKDKIAHLEREQQSTKKDDDEPPMFDAFKAFDIVPDHESTIKKLQSQIDERDNQCSKLSQELENLSIQISEERMLAQQAQARFNEEILQLQSQLGTVNKEYVNLGSELQRHLSPLCGADKEEVEVLRRTIEEKVKEVEYLSNELGNLNEEHKRVLDEKAATTAEWDNNRIILENQIQESLSEKEELETKLNDLSAQQVVLNQEIEALQITICNLEQKEEEDNKVIDDNDIHIKTMEADKDALKDEIVRYQKENTDLAMRLQELEEDLNTIHKTKADLEEEVMKLRQTVSEKEKELEEKSEKLIHQSLIRQEEPVVHEPVIRQEELTHQPLVHQEELTHQPLVHQEELTHQPLVHQEEVPSISQGWDEENIEKLELEEGWGWNSEQMPDTQAEVKPGNLEAELLTKITELECEIKKLEREKEIMTDSNRALQLKCDKALKKLMQKVKQEKLMRLHQQKSSSSLCDLDQTIVDELKSQISSLEKSLSETTEQHKKTLEEKENLMKSIDVMVSAQEEYLKIKERQDMSLEVYEIQKKELAAKVESLELQLQAASYAPEIQGPIAEAQKSSPEEQISFDPTPSICDIEKHREQINELKENVEALAYENEQLQQLLDEQRNTRLDLETKLTNEWTQKLEDSDKKHAELKTTYDRIKEEYDFLRKQYEQTLMDANEQVQAIRRNNELLQEELNERIAKHESELSSMVDNSKQEITALKEDLEKAVQEKEQAFKKLSDLSNVEERFSSASTSLMDVSELLNMRVQEVAALKEELKRQCDDRLLIERKFHESNEQLLLELNKKQTQLDEFVSLSNEKEHIVYHQTEEIKKLKEAVNELERSKMEYIAEISVKNAEVERHVQELKMLQEMVNERESIYSACQADTTSKEFEISSQNVRIGDCEMELKKYAKEVERYSAEVHRLKDLLYEEASRRGNLIEESLGLKLDLSEKSLNLEKCTDDIGKCVEEVQKGSKELDRLNDIIERDQIEIERLSSIMQSESINFNTLINHLTSKDQQISQMRQALEEKEVIINNINSALAEKQAELDKFNEQSEKEKEPTPLDTVPIFTMTGDDDVDKLRAELVAKQVEIDNLTYALNKNTYPRILQDLQDTINKLYNDKAQLEMTLGNCEEENEKLKQQLNAQAQEFQNREVAKHESVEKRLISNQEEIARLQNELHLKEQEINELKYIIGEKDAKLQATMETSPEDLDLRQTIDMLNSQLFAKHQEAQSLEFTINSLRSELENVKQDERFSEEYKAALESQKEEITKLHEEIDYYHEQIREQDKEISKVHGDLAEKERRLAELSITKDTEIHNLKVLLHERDVRIEELHALSEEEDKQLTELKKMLTKKEEEVEELKRQLAEKVQELELVTTALQRHVPDNRESSAKDEDSGSSELDLALYMLHQRDVRCEELTQELMQLLEERDTLQLRLSNAIRINEDLRKLADAAPKEPAASTSAPSVENPSPSKSEGPVEIAKEAINTPISLDEDHDALVKNEGCTESVERATELAVGEKVNTYCILDLIPEYSEGSPHVIDERGDDEK